MIKKIINPIYSANRRMVKRNLNLRLIHLGLLKVLSEEFKSIGFYLTNHPLNEFEEMFNQLNINSYNQFYENDLIEGLVVEPNVNSRKKKCKRHAVCNSKV